MKLSEFDFDLPEQLIAQQPLANRSGSRLLVLGQEPGALTELSFDQLAKLLKEGDMLVVNDTRVLPARVQARKPTGGRVEIMLERLLDAHRALVMLGANKPVKSGAVLHIGDIEATVLSRRGPFFEIEFPASLDAQAVFTQHGSMPLPPYIQRKASRTDETRYQTVYSRNPGAVAAPTAGLHFDEALIERLRSAGIQWGQVTLHVGAGTFTPVKVEDTADHVMHSERITVSEQLCDQVEATRIGGGRVVAVGTTVVRTLESAALGGELVPCDTETRLFIEPGFNFRVVDALITNFHLPRSSLLVMLSAFSGHQRIMQAYQYAVAHGFRFFSYGDAMFVERN